MSIEHGGFNIASWRNKDARLSLTGTACVECQSEGVKRPASLGQRMCNEHKELHRQEHLATRQEQLISTQEVVVFEHTKTT